jgi:(p)ppGpp synthase/HD superfamily hydrolase
MVSSNYLTDSIVHSAYVFAFAAHSAVGQKRKYTDEHYISHPEKVVQILRDYITFPSNDMLCAAWLHDVLEDTQVTYDQIAELFGNDVAMMVLQVSKPKELFHGKKRHERHLLTIERLKETSVSAANIKIADIISNCRNLEEVDPSFSEKYFKEKREQLAVLQHANPFLLKVAQELIKDTRNE